MMLETRGRTSTVSAASKVPDAILHEIFQRRTDLEDSGRARRCALVDASRVCSRWRRVVHSLPHFWTKLDHLSPRELVGLPLLLQLSRSALFDLEADLGTLLPEDSRRFLEHLAPHMPRARSLDLRGVAFDLRPRGALFAAAPVLSSLTLDFAASVSAVPTIAANIFSGTAPRLKMVSVPWALLPRSCAAFANVTVFRPLMSHGGHPSIRPDMLFTVLPKLESLILSTAGGLGKFSLQGACRKALQRLEASLENNAATTQPIIAIMPAFLHECIPFVHLRLAAPNTVTFVRKRLALIVHLFVFRSAAACHITLVDTKDRIRVFSSVNAATITRTLRLAELFESLTSLSIWEYMHKEDVASLFRHKAPALRRLTLFVRPATSADVSGGQMHIFDAAERQPWACHALRSLHITSKDISYGGLFPVAASDGHSISARRLKSFVEGSLILDKQRLDRVVLEGVAIREADGQQYLDQIADEVVL